MKIIGYCEDCLYVRFEENIYICQKYHMIVGRFQFCKAFVKKKLKIMKKIKSCKNCCFVEKRDTLYFCKKYKIWCFENEYCSFFDLKKEELNKHGRRGCN